MYVRRGVWRVATTSIYHKLCLIWVQEEVIVKTTDTDS